MKESLIRRRFHRKVHTLGESCSTTDYVKLSTYGGDYVSPLVINQGSRGR